MRRFPFKKFLLLLGISWISAVGIKFTEESFRFEPYLISNFYANEFYQTLNPPRPSDDIVLVSGPPYNDQDSLLGELISKISLHKPKVIAVDYDITEERLFKKFRIRDSVSVVLASAFDDSDTIQNPVNIFDAGVHFAHVSGGNNNFLLKESNSIPSLPEKVLELYSPDLFRKYMERHMEYDYVNYPSPNRVHLYFSENGDFESELFNNRVVLVGKFGSANINPIPGWKDNTDIHDTPIGWQFGTYVLYSQLNTMLGNYIEQVPSWLEYLLCLLVCGFSIALIFITRKVHPKIVYIGTKIYTLIAIFLLHFLCFLIFNSLNTILDYRFLCWSVIISVELAFWALLETRNSLKEIP
jgi:CHASE2 domain